MAEGAGTPSCRNAGCARLHRHRGASPGAGLRSADEIKMRVGALPAFPDQRAQIQPDLERGRPHQRVLPSLRGDPRGRDDRDACRSKGWSTSPRRRRVRSVQHLRRSRHAVRNLSGKVRNLDYKSVRYPGHRDLMQFCCPSCARRRSGRSGHHAAERCRRPCGTWCWCSSRCQKACGVRCGGVLRARFLPVIHRAGTARPSRSPPLPASAPRLDLFHRGKLPRSGFIRQGTGSAARLSGQPLRRRLPTVAPHRVHSQHRITVCSGAPISPCDRRISTSA